MSIRLTYVLGFIISLVILLISAYLQFYKGFLPCPLCVLQRIMFGILGFCFLLGTLLSAQFCSRLIINSLALISAGAGIFLAGRQVWLQHFPSASSNECGVSIQYMLKILPITEVFQRVLQGSSECSNRGLEFFNMNMAEWALLWFIIMFSLILFLFFKETKIKQKQCMQR